MTLWEQAAELGGQVRLAAKLPGQQAFTDLIAYQQERLGEPGAEIVLGRTATVEALLAAEADVIGIATGGVARRPAIAGFDDPRVCDAWQLLRREATVGERVAIVVQEDGAAPLALADMLAREHREVTLFIQTNGPAPQLSRYSMGALLGRLSEAGVRIVYNEVATAITLPELVTRHAYSRCESRFEGFDNVVLACGASSRAEPHVSADISLPSEYDLHEGEIVAPRISFAKDVKRALVRRLAPDCHRRRSREFAESKHRRRQGVDDSLRVARADRI